MKRLSIKANITLWYTALLLVFLAFVMLFVLYISDTLMMSKAKSDLINIVQKNAQDIGAIDGLPDLSDMERYDNGVNILVHSMNGDLIFGRYPTGFPEQTTLINDTVQTITSDKASWFVYDYLVASTLQESVIIRGISSSEIVNQTIQTATRSAILILPIFLLLAALGGYRITQRAFRPVQKIADAAVKINNGEDLSKRIGFIGSTDEISALAETFDGMFDRLQKSFERERQFTADASHELRTPTAVIMSQCEYALSEIDNKKEVSDSLNIILRQSQKMTGLISQLLLLTYSENPSHKLAMESFDFSELAEIVIAEMRLSAKAAGISIETQIEPSIIIRADHALMARLLINLLSNGIKYGKQGGYVKVAISKDGGSLVCSVSDNGIGIGEEHLDRIWDRFYQVNPSRTSDNADSMGFGLSMVKWIATAHNAKITVRSVLGEGSTFTLNIPILL